MLRRPLWRPTRKQVLVVLGLVLAIILAVAGYWVRWTGFDAYPPGVEWDELPPQRERTVWDWMQLLIVPAMIALGGLWFNRTEKEREQIRAEQRAETERAISDRRLQEEAIQTYFDRMEALLLDRGLSDFEPPFEVVTLARARTLALLRRLDGIRKGEILQFLYDSALIEVNDPKVDLFDADLDEAWLEMAMLEGAHLAGVYFYKANLRHALLAEANLGGAYLDDADLCWADLRGADLQFMSWSDETKFTGAIYDSRTRWPTRFDCVEAGVEQVEDRPSLPRLRRVSSGSEQTTTLPVTAEASSDLGSGVAPPKTENSPKP